MLSIDLIICRLYISLRHGFGFDIEFNEQICHILVNNEGDEELFAYNGIIIKLPFCQLFIGDYYEVYE